MALVTYRGQSFCVAENTLPDRQIFRTKNYVAIFFPRKLFILEKTILDEINFPHKKRILKKQIMDKQFVR